MRIWFFVFVVPVATVADSRAGKDRASYSGFAFCLCWRGDDYGSLF